MMDKEKEDLVPNTPVVKPEDKKDNNEVLLGDDEVEDGED